MIKVVKMLYKVYANNKLLNNIINISHPCKLLKGKFKDNNKIILRTFQRLFFQINLNNN